jgi:hypothetical protein
MAMQAELTPAERKALVHISRGPVDSGFLREPPLARLYIKGLVRVVDGFFVLTVAGKQVWRRLQILVDG